MRFSKKAIPVVAFALGACVFVSTAFADMALGTGYDRLKESAKRTAAQMEKGLDNYTVEALFTLKDNDEVWLQSSTVSKIDTVKQASEDRSVTKQAGREETSNFSFTDPDRRIWKHSGDEKYYVYDNYDPDGSRFPNPFDQEGASEVERIIDAVVGGLRDQVQVEEAADGGVAYSGSLGEAQVPAVVNAVASFLMKQLISDQARGPEEERLPAIESDIYVKKVTGTASENEAGLLVGATGEVVLSGKDENGVTHDITASVVATLTGIGTTKVEAPVLKDEEIETVARSGFSDKYVGVYRNNIVMEKDGRFVKIGERTLEISGIEDDGQVAGKFYETVKPEFASEYGEVHNFEFKYDPDNSKPMSLFTYTDASGEQKNGFLSPGGAGNVYLDLNITITGEGSYQSEGLPYFNGQFVRVFEE